jgi:hypothetical protein
MTVYINESSTFTVQARFYNQASDPAIPNAVRYLIRDISNDRLVKDWTSLTPAASIDIEIAASDNAIHEDTPSTRRYEQRVLTVQANPGEVTQYVDEIEYWVRNLAGIVND